MWQASRALKKVEEEGRTRVWLAQYVGQTPQSINGFLSGRRVPTKPVIKLLAQALNTTEAYLMGKDLESTHKEASEPNT